MKKKCKVVMLPTEKASDITTVGCGEDQMLYHISDEEFENYDITTFPPNFTEKDGYNQDVVYNNQHLYLISDDEIKEGDWYYSQSFDYPNISQAKSDGEGVDMGKKFDAKKVIASTDSELTRTGDEGIVDLICGNNFPQIPESFIKAFVKANGKIDEVMVEYFLWCDNCGEENCDNFRCRDASTDIWMPKLTDNNEVIIHLEEEKMYSREEVAEIIRKYFSNDEGIVDEDDREKWIEENL